MLLILSLGLAAQQNANHSGAIYQQLQKLNTVGSVLYVAAHPDDENTQMISYFANGLHLRTGYLSATRGDGGQNLIGTEIGEQLGLIRTQELLAARRIDGGEQFFSRAIDFGFSKNPDETFEKWGKEATLEDFVWVIRKFRPDVIVTRFGLEPGVTHGHHTASAILAKEAFEIAGDPSVFPEQLAYVEPWKPAKIFWNIGVWYYRATGQKFDETGLLKVDVGGYNRYLGESYTEISARSRSMHKSQGFGDAPGRGVEYEYLRPWAGAETGDIFGGIDQSWSRLKNGSAPGDQLKLALQNFNPNRPELVLPNLLEARNEVMKLEDLFWKEIKLEEIDHAIRMITGTFISLSADRDYATPGDTLVVTLQGINRSGVDVKLASVSFSTGDDRFVYNLPMPENQLTSFSYKLPISSDADYTTPYWLAEAPSAIGRYEVNDPLKIGLPENRPWLRAWVNLKVEDAFLDFELPVVFITTDRVRGEVTQPLVLGPKLLVQVDDKPLFFANNSPKNLTVTVQAASENQSGVLALNMPAGWTCSPKEIPFSLTKAGSEFRAVFSITPATTAHTGVVSAIVTTTAGQFDRGKIVVDYEHIPLQTHFPKAEVKVVRLDLQLVGNRIGYIMGSGDEVAACLRQVGYQVDLLERDDVVAERLARYDAVIVGIRAFNTLEWLSYKNEDLFRYAEKGGTVIVQYNTADVVTDKLAPVSLKLSRERVTVEDAPVQFLNPAHPVLNRPNKITNSDFDLWVQERGLYFPSQWGEPFEPVLGMADPGEPQRNGSLLVMKHGKGHYIYTGLSFFRELPAGVPGAYRLMANMIAIGKAPAK